VRRMIRTQQSHDAHDHLLNRRYREHAPGALSRDRILNRTPRCAMRNHEDGRIRLCITNDARSTGEPAPCGASRTRTSASERCTG
jgi:hypothetical protein